MDGLGSASPPVAPTATTGEGRHPCTWPRTFWFKPLSAFGLLDLTTFISSSPELAMPSTLAPDRLSASSRRALSREARPPWVGEVTLSQELRTARSPRPHVLVGYQWSHTGLRPGRKTSHNRYIRSFVSHPPQIRTCTSMHPVPHLRTSLRRSAGRGPHGPDGSSGDTIPNCLGEFREIRESKERTRGRKGPTTLPLCQKVGGPFRSFQERRKCLLTRPGHESGVRDSKGGRWYWLYGL